MFHRPQLGHDGAAQVKTTGTGVKDVRQGIIMDADGTQAMVIWLELAATSPVTLHINGAKPKAGYTQ